MRTATSSSSSVMTARHSKSRTSTASSAKSFLVSAPAPLARDEEFDEVELPPAKYRKLATGARKARVSEPKPRKRASSPRPVKKKTSRDLDRARTCWTEDFGEDDGDDVENPVKRSAPPRPNPLLKLLNMNSDKSIVPPAASVHRPADAINDDSEAEAAEDRILGSDIDPDEDGEGSETEPESGPEDGNGAANADDDEGDVTEPESDGEMDADVHSQLRSREDVPRLPGYAVRPQLGALRSDQTAKGKYVLRRPKVGYDGTRIPSGSEHSIPASINRYLRDYQREGVDFFYSNYCEGRGGVLGDDMGLGKTIQVIAFLSAIMLKDNDARDINRRKNYVSKLQDELEDDGGPATLPPANSKWPTALIIVPVAVIDNWKRELDTWGYFEVGAYSAGSRDRERVMKDFKLGRLDILLASFDLVRDCIDQFDDLALSVIFLDEAHKIKNANALITKAYGRFKCEVRFGLTGTAVQNDQNELWPLLDWTNPGRLGTQKEWKKTITEPIKVGQSHSATEEERLYAVRLAKHLVVDLLPKFFKRRTKDLIKAQLPEKYDEIVFCPLTKLQLEVYENFLKSEDIQLILRKDEPCECERGQRKKVSRSKCCHRTDDEGNPWLAKMLASISVLLKVSNHPALIYPTNADTLEQKERNREYLKIAFPDRPEMQKASGAFSADMCGKWNVLRQLLDAWHSDKEAKNQVLIFSKSVKLLQFLELEISKIYGRDHICCLDGKMKAEDRTANIDAFNNNPDKFVFLISTRAGGVGLNLVSANRVVIFDPSWNPAHDLQAMDRAYRYRQLRDVYVYRMLTSGGLEELIYARQLYKQQMMNITYEGTAQTRFFDGVQGDKNRQGELFGLKNIFSLQKSAYATKTVIERARVEEMEWAFANHGGAKANDMDDMGGLGTLLLDDASQVEDDSQSQSQSQPGLRKPKRKSTRESSLITSILEHNNVQYVHLNSDIVGNEAGNIAQRAAEQAHPKPAPRPRKPKVKLVPGDPEYGVPEWPPTRKKHERAARANAGPAGQKLLEYKHLLVGSGLISNTGSSYREFAVEFGNMGKAAQEKLIRNLEAGVFNKVEEEIEKMRGHEGSGQVEEEEDAPHEEDGEEE